MEVIMLEDVKGLGSHGDRVKVRAGYARNYLIPNKLAINASGAGAKIFAEVQRQRAHRDGKLKKGAQEVAARFEELEVKLPMEVGEEDRLFGSVTSADIAAALLEQGVEVDKRKIQLDEPLKALGLYSVPVKLFQDVEATVKVWVVKK